MTKDDIEKGMKEYWPIVKGKPISKEWPKHLIGGFGIEETAPGYYELYVLAQDNSTSSTLKKTLNQWLVDFGEV